LSGASAFSFGDGTFFLQAVPPRAIKAQSASAQPRVLLDLVMRTLVASLGSRRPRRRRIIATPGGQFFLSPTVAVGEPQRAPSAARRREREVPPVGRPGRILVAAGAGDRLRVRAVGAGDHDLERAAGPRGPGDEVALGGPRGRGVVAAGPRDAR